MSERAGYTLTMFLVDISPSMGKTRQVTVAGPAGDDTQVIEMTVLEWSLQYVMLKIQEMIFNGRKTDKCGVIVFGSEETNNYINDTSGGYENVAEYLPVAQPNASSLAKLAKLQPSTICGDPIDALIVAIETQDHELGNKKWTRKIVLLTDGESPMEVEDWDATVKKMNALDISLTIVGVDFDDDDYPFHEENKSNIKRENESFYHTLVAQLNSGVVGNCDFALQEVSRPDIRQVKSALMITVLRIGDMETRKEEAIELVVKTSKCTALARPKSWKKFARRKHLTGDGSVRVSSMDEDGDVAAFAQLRMRSEFYLADKDDKEEDGDASGDGDVSMEGTRTKPTKPEPIKIDKGELIRGYKYGASFAPAPPEGAFPRQETLKGISICGFFQKKNFRRELAMGEVSYIWADPANPKSQVGLSSIVQAMYEKGVVAIARWVSRDKMDPKMGVLLPTVFEEVDCFLWVQMPFADDVRNYPFASLETLINKKGEVVEDHPYLPNSEQMTAMDAFVDAMDLSEAGEKDEEGNRDPWFDTRLSYNPAIHRTKQALFHGAIVQDLNTHPLPPPHPELLKYIDPPRRVIKRARDAIEECKKSFKVREVPKKVARVRKDGHVRANEEDEDMLLLDQKGPAQAGPSQLKSSTQTQSQMQSQTVKPKSDAADADSSATEEEPEEDDELMLDAAPARKPARDNAPLPTPDRSLSPDPLVDRMREPGRIVGLSFPLQDFKKNISRGDVVTKAVEDLAYVIGEVVTKPFSSRRFDEMIGCMHELRKVALEEDEIDAWNAFIRKLRNTCLDSKPGNKAFWDKVTRVGRKLSFISSPEASDAGGRSDITESEAQEFIQR